MKKMIILLAAGLLVFSVACSGDDAKDAADSAADAADNAADNAAGNAASDMMNKAGSAADDAAKAATDSAHGMAASATDAVAGRAGSVVTSCRAMAESGDFGAALEVCKQAHEMMPDDPALEHAYQQAQAAAGH